MVTYLDKGANVEADVLNNINSVLPQGVKDALPADIKVGKKLFGGGLSPWF